MTRFEQMDQLLKKYYHMAKRNSNYIYKKDISRSIKKYNIPSKDVDVDLGLYFSKWIRYFEGRKNISACILPFWSYFCQFMSDDQKTYTNIKKEDKSIKLYISLDSEHIDKGVLMIFDFIEKNNIINISKVGANIKSDTIVIRVENIKDAKMIMNFVKRNKYLQEGIYKNTNPFIPNINGVSYTIDGSLSYTTMISSVIGMFINEWVKNRELEPNLMDLYKYVSNMEKKLFRRGIKAEKSIVTVDSLIGDGDYSKQDVLSLKVAFNLFLKTLDKNFDFKDFCSFALESEDKENYYYDNNIDVETILREELLILSKKYGFDQAILNIDAYSKTVDLGYISSKNNMRERFKDIDFLYYLNKYLTDNNISCRQLCNRLLNINDRVFEQSELYEMFEPYLQDNNSSRNVK